MNVSLSGKISQCFVYLFVTVSVSLFSIVNIFSFIFTLHGCQVSKFRSMVQQSNLCMQ